MIDSKTLNNAISKITMSLSEDPVDPLNPTEKWVWVEGYKGTDKDMKCKNDFQYELGKRFDMPEDAVILECSSGFHLCLDLKDVFEYVTLGCGNRFFKVRALVRERDVDRYGTPKRGAWLDWGNYDKIAAKSIELIRELTVDEILEAYPETADWSDEVKQMAVTDSYHKANTRHKVIVLTQMGYAEPLAEYICSHCDGSGYDLAVALNAQTDISMDTKISAIFSHI